MLRSSLVLVALAAFAAPAFSQTAPPPRLRVFLDCGSCYQDYLRDQIKWVDFVRQPQDSDVHILDNSNSTGGGGREVVIRFVGNGRLRTIDRELRVVTQAADTDQRQRELMLRTISVGLLEYMAREGLPPELQVRVTAPATAGPATPVADPWNRWVFSLSGGGSFDDEETQREVSWEGDANADRITDHWKISFGVETNVRNERFELDEDEEPFEVTRRERRFEWFVAKSAGAHWSFGTDGSVESSTFTNLGFSVQAAPAVEFSVFPYRDYASKRWVIQYDVGIEKNRYNEITLFGEEQETLWRQALESNIEAEQPWGSVEAGVEFTQYLHDRSLYRVEVSGETSIRIARGLSFEVSASISRIRDQITLPRRDATEEEILLRLRELQSGYNIFTSFGISYSFGSLFNNVVNPRFR